MGIYLSYKERIKEDIKTETIETIVDIPVNWILIFGHFGFPSLGVRGAAIGTVFSELAGTVIYASSFVKSSNRIEYSTSSFKLEPVLLKPLLKYGIPSGFGTLVEAFGYSVFVLVLGYYGAVRAQITKMLKTDGGEHAAEEETSEVMAARPGLVKLERAATQSGETLNRPPCNSRIV